MIESLLTWFYSYVSYYALDIVLFLLIGYVFIRCRTIGYAFSAVLVLVLIFFSYVGGYVMPQLDTALVILLGTLAGGWRYVARARYGQLSFGLPFFGRFSASSKPSILERFDAFLARRRYQKTYTEELARENAKYDANSSASKSSSSQTRNKTSKKSTNRKPHNSRGGTKKPPPSKPEKKKTTNRAKTKQEQRKERFNRSRSKAPPNATATPSTRTPLEVLGLSSGYTQAELKDRYRRLASQYHPDKYQNMSDTVKQEMNTEFVAVKQAYEQLK